MSAGSCHEGREGAEAWTAARVPSEPLTIKCFYMSIKKVINFPILYAEADLFCVVQNQDSSCFGFFDGFVQRWARDRRCARGFDHIRASLEHGAFFDVYGGCLAITD
jgi:hypothetical protein